MAEYLTEVILWPYEANGCTAMETGIMLKIDSKHKLAVVNQKTKEISHRSP